MKSKVVDKKFKSFDETFNICTFSMAIGLMYPNKLNVRKRCLVFLFVTVLNSPEIFWFIMYFFSCLYKGDIYNFTRHVTVLIVIGLYVFKTIYAIHKSNEFNRLLRQITEDLLVGNSLDEDYQEIYQRYVKSAKIGEICWFVVPLLLVMQFPLTPVIRMIYEYITTGSWDKYMSHEMELYFFEEKQYESPYFEIIFASNCIQGLILVPNFSGFDASFCIATTHLCLKLEVVALSVKRAFDDANDHIELRNLIKNTIQKHQDALVFYNNLKKVYEGWLFAVFLMTSLLISFNVYQIFVVKRVDPKYTVFFVSAVLHMYMPCYYASKLIKVNEDLCANIYLAKWETRLDPVATKSLVFMIAKSQDPLILTGKGIVTFDMKLFISIMQTSYSFFTLISTK